MDAAPGLLPVEILGLPLDVYQRASEHNDELLREFALIREDGSDHVPARLLALIEELHGRFGAFTEGPTSALQGALVRGDRDIDLHYEVPAEAADGAVRLGALLDEADAFCRSGDLLTLATVPESLAFRRWFLDEFVSQIAGHPPRSWPAFMAGRAGG
ncbi:MAG: hypothetical protein ACRD1D_13190 [Acidimicrobiales bacterium]